MPLIPRITMFESVRFVHFSLCNMCNFEGNGYALILINETDNIYNQLL